MPPDETTDPNIIIKNIFKQGATTQKMVQANTQKIEAVDRKLDTHLQEHGITERVKEKAWGKTKNIIGLVLAAITIISACYGLTKLLRPDMKALAAEIKKELPRVEYRMRPGEDGIEIEEDP